MKEASRLNFRPILLAIAVATAGVMPAFLIGGLSVQVRGELRFSEASLGLAVAAFFACASLASVVMGRVVERIGSHNGMRLAVTMSAISLLGIAALARSWTGLVLCLVLGGFANATAHPSANLSLAREVPLGRQGLSFGIKQASIPTATLFAGLAVPLVAVTVGWRWAFAGAAILALCVAVIVPKEELGGVTNSKRARTSDARPWSLIVLALGIGLGSTAATPLGAFVVESSVNSGLKAGTAGLLLAAGSAFSIVVRIFFGNFADGMSSGRLRIVAGMLALGIVGFGMLASGVEALLVIGVMLAFGAGWGWPGLFNFAVVKSNPGAPAAATGITQTGASAGAALGPLIFGFVVQTSSYSTAWILCGVFALLALTAILIGRRLLVRDRILLEQAIS